MRIYNPALGRFLSVDPLTNSYPWYTPYQFAGNTPIQAIDMDGLEELIITRNYSKCGNNYKTIIKVVNANAPLSITYNLLYDTDKKQIPVTTQVKDFTDENEKNTFNANWIVNTNTFIGEEGNSDPSLTILYTLPKEAPVKFMVELDLSDIVDGKGSVNMLTIKDANGEIVFQKEYYSYSLVNAKNDFVKDIKKVVGTHSSQTSIKIEAGIIEGNKGLSKTIGNILKVAINPTATVELSPTRKGSGTASGDAERQKGELSGEGGNNAQVEIDVKGGEKDNSATIPLDKRGG